MSTRAIKLVSLLLCSASLAWVVKFSENCPANNPKVTWYDYINNKVPPPGGEGNVFGVQFRFAKELGDPDAYGNLATDACYLVKNVTNPKHKSSKKGFYSVRTFRRNKGDKADSKQGLPGNAENWEINVYGTIFLFNNNGEVIDRRGRTVGLLVCYGSNECDRY